MTDIRIPLARDSDLLTRCRQLRNQGIDPATETRHESLPGLSARLLEFHAALGNVQLQRLEKSLARHQATPPPAEHWVQAFGCASTKPAVCCIGWYRALRAGRGAESVPELSASIRLD